MKTRESGMPDETMGDGFFDPPHVMELLGIRGLTGDAVEFGCGYGRFTTDTVLGPITLRLEVFCGFLVDIGVRLA
jgi:hypothetical protein